MMIPLGTNCAAEIRPPNAACSQAKMRELMPTGTVCDKLSNTLESGDYEHFIIVSPSASHGLVRRLLETRAVPHGAVTPRFYLRRTSLPTLKLDSRSYAPRALECRDTMLS